MKRQTGLALHSGQASWSLIVSLYGFQSTLGRHQGEEKKWKETKREREISLKQEYMLSQ